jgi:hypothetical protein
MSAPQHRLDDAVSIRLATSLIATGRNQSYLMVIDVRRGGGGQGLPQLCQ